MPGPNRAGRIPKSGKARYDWLMPDGKPLHVACHKAKKSECGDKWTIVYTRLYDGYTHLRGCNDIPFHPSFGVAYFNDYPRGQKLSLGSRIKFEELPPDVQKLAIQDYLELWNIDDKPMRYRETPNPEAGIV